MPRSQPIGLSPAEIAELRNWNFMELYTNNRSRFVRTAQGAYLATCNLINISSSAAAQSITPFTGQRVTPYTGQQIDPFTGQRVTPYTGQQVNPPTDQQNNPTAWQCCKQCCSMLMCIDLFTNKAVQQFGGAVGLLEHVAELLARHILDQNWADISESGCP